MALTAHEHDVLADEFYSLIETSDLARHEWVEMQRSFEEIYNSWAAAWDVDDEEGMDLAVEQMEELIEEARVAQPV